MCAILGKPVFWHIFAMTAFSTAGGVFLLNNIKACVNEYFDDMFLNTAAAIGLLCSHLSRGLWGALYSQRFLGFKRTYLTLLVLQMGFGCTLPEVIDQRAAFLVWTVVLLSCLGGQVVVFSRVCSLNFGVKFFIIYTGVFAGSAIAAVLNVFVDRGISYKQALLSLNALNGISIVLLAFYKYRENMQWHTKTYAEYAEEHRDTISTY